MHLDTDRPSDTEFIKDIQAGGVARERALAWFAHDKKLKDWIIGIARKRPETEQAGEQLFQRTLEIFYRKITNRDFERTASLKTFFVAIAKLEINNLCREKRTEQQHTPAPYDPDLLLQNAGAHSDPWSEREAEREKHWEKILNDHFQIRELCKKIILMQLKGYDNEEIKAAVEVTDIHRERYRCFQQFRKFTDDNPHLFEILKN